MLVVKFNFDFLLTKNLKLFGRRLPSLLQPRENINRRANYYASSVLTSTTNHRAFFSAISR